MKYFKTNKEFYIDKDIRDAYIQNVKGKMPLIRFRSLDAIAGVEACFTTRMGGVSTGHLESLNLGFSVGDSPDNIKQNFLLCAQRTHTNLKDFVLTDQVHSDKVLLADSSMAVGEEFVKKAKACDGFYTKQSDLVLSATFADCVPIYLVDKVDRQIALVHSGWKGTVKKIGKKAVELMCQNGSSSSNIVAVIGPSISQNNYEVTGEIIEELKKGFSKDAMKDIAYKTDDKHYQLDLWAACYYYLIEAGINRDNIHFSGICTFDNYTELFSHRRTGGKRGNMNAFLWMPSIMKKNNPKAGKINEAPAEVLAQALSEMINKDKK